MIKNPSSIYIYVWPWPFDDHASMRAQDGPFFHHIILCIGSICADGMYLSCNLCRLLAGLTCLGLVLCIYEKNLSKLIQCFQNSLSAVVPLYDVMRVCMVNIFGCVLWIPNVILCQNHATIIREAVLSFSVQLYEQQRIDLRLAHLKLSYYLPLSSYQNICQNVRYIWFSCHVPPCN
jgi:hypothetical protein